jgi:hypothetical protein
LPVSDEEQALWVSQSHRRRVTEERVMRLANFVNVFGQEIRMETRGENSLEVVVKKERRMGEEE